MDDVAALVDAAGARTTTLIAHDWGGIVAWWFALREVRPLERLVVMNLPHPAVAERVLRRSPRQWLRSWYVAFFQLPVLPERWLTAGGARRVAAASADSICCCRNPCGSAPRLDREPGRGQGAAVDGAGCPPDGGRLAAAVALAGLAPLSLALLDLVDTGALGVLRQLPGRFVAPAQVRVPSLVLCAVLYAAVGPGRSWGRPRAGSWRVWAVAAAWLVAAGGVVAATDVYVPGVAGWRNAVAFHATRVLAEELLFRGALYQLVRRLAPGRVAGPFSVPVVATAVLFALSHFQYHAFRLTVASVTQVAYNVPTGVLLGWLRERTGSVWSSVALHAATNSLRLVPR